MFDSVTPWTAACQASLSFTISQSLLKCMSVELVMPSSHLILCCPLLLLPSIFLSIRVFSNESALHIRWPKVGASASASVLPMSIQDWFPLGLTGLISLQFKELPRVFPNTTVQKHQFFGTQLFYMLSRFVIAFPPRSKCLLISWLQSPSAVILEPKKIKSVTVSTFSPSICHEVMPQS